MSVANPLWGAPRIHSELLKLGLDVGQTTIAKYMTKEKTVTVARLQGLPSQSCRRYRVNRHVRGPTISFRQLGGLLVLQPSRRELLWLGVTTYPTAEWIAPPIDRSLRPELPSYIDTAAV
jgi:hypothetical protein